MPGSKQTTEQSTKRDPWAPAQGNLRTALTNAGNLAGDLGNFKPQISDTYNQSLDRMEALGTQPNAVSQYLQPVVAGSEQNFQGGSDYLRGVMNGDPTSNPYLEQIIAKQREGTSNAVNGQFSAAGRYGSGAHSGVLADRLGQQELNLRYGDYNAQQGRMDNAAGTLFNQGFQGSQLAPQLDNSNYQQAGILQNVGQQRNAILDAENTAGLRANEWLNSQTVPIAGLGGTSDSTSVQSKPANTAGMIMGGLQMGAGLMTGNPMMAMGGFGSMSGGGGF